MTYSTRTVKKILKKKKKKKENSKRKLKKREIALLYMKILYPVISIKPHGICTGTNGLKPRVQTQPQLCVEI